MKPWGFIGHDYIAWGFVFGRLITALPSEIGQCNAYLSVELATLPRAAAVLALGRIAHDAALRALKQPPSKFRFSHGARHELPNSVVLFDSYHCSRYNTNTKRLTPQMFRDVFDKVAGYLGILKTGLV